MSLFPPVPQVILTHLQEDSSFIVIGHKSPDGDCISSELGMEFLLKALGKQVLLANAGPFERQEIQSLRGRFADHIPEAYLAERPTVVVVDCSTSDRIGSLFEQVKDLHVIVIDHAGDKTCISFRILLPPPCSSSIFLKHSRSRFRKKRQSDSSSDSLPTPASSASCRSIRPRPSIQSRAW